VSTPQLIRFLIVLGGMIAGVTAFLVIPIPWLAVTAGLLIPLTDFVVAEIVFRRLADREEQRRDLEDRVRHPPL
jgi:hypothetical protein